MNRPGSPVPWWNFSQSPLSHSLSLSSPYGWTRLREFSTGLSSQTPGQHADLDDIASRISALASVHRYLQDSESADVVDLHTHLGRVVSGALGSVPTVSIQNDVATMPVPTKTAVNLGLAINEIATNAAKHGFAPGEQPRFRMQSRIADSILVLTASNSGHPLPTEISLDSPPSLGLRLVSTLVKQLGGSVSLKRTPQALVEIRVPYASARWPDGSNAGDEPI